MFGTFEGDLLLAFVLLAVVFDIKKNEIPNNTTKDRFLARITLIYLGTLILSMIRTMLLCRGKPHTLLPFFNSLFPFLIPLMLFLWFHFILYSLPLTTQTKKLLTTVATLPLFLLFLFSLVNLVNEDFFYLFNEKGQLQNCLGKYLQYALCLLYALATLVLALGSCKRKGSSTAKLFLLFPTLNFISVLFFVLKGNPLFINASLTASLLVTYFDIQGRKISFDLLTGLPNLKAFQVDLDRTIAKGENGNVLLINIRNFKYFNQKFGQSCGDLLLQDMGKYFSQFLPNQKVYRLYCDKFVLLLRKTSEKEALCMGRVIQDRFSSAWNLGKINTKVDIHIAMVTYPNQVTSAEKALNAITFTMAEEKQNHPKQISIFNQELLQRKQRKLEIVEALKRSIANGKFEIQYQPVYDTVTKKIVSAEALLRMDDAILGRLQPDEFIPIAEETGLIVEITYWIIQQVCDFLNRLRISSLENERIAINLSAVHFLYPEMRQKIMEIIKKNGINPHAIIFELTESAVIDSFEPVENTMRWLSQQGVSFSMDDYGKGYSNIEYLIKFPFDTVKLDRSIIVNYKSSSVLLESLVLMLKRIGKTLVAEGVESEDQYQALKKMGVDQIQGFLFSRPLEEDGLLQLLLANKNKN